MPASLVDQYRRWFAYEIDSHRRVLASLETVPESGRGSAQYQKALDLMGHILAARRVWLHRLDPSFAMPAAVFPAGVSFAGLGDDFETMGRDWTGFLNRLTDADLDRTFTSRTSQGDWFRQTIGDTLTHMYGHSHYHRGQIATLVRAAGGEPAATDFIFWVREPAEPPGA